MLDESRLIAGAPKLNDGPEEAGDGVEGLVAAMCEKEMSAPEDVEAIGGEGRVDSA
jgi:hypothetical protein